MRHAARAISSFIVKRWRYSRIVYCRSSCWARGKERGSSNRAFYSRCAISIGGILVPALANGRRPEEFATIIKDKEKIFRQRSSFIALSLWNSALSTTLSNGRFKDLSRRPLRAKGCRQSARRKMGCAHKKWYFIQNINPITCWL